jgi:hypothetical protein
VCFNRGDKTFEVLIAGVAPLANEPAKALRIDPTPTDERPMNPLLDSQPR